MVKVDMKLVNIINKLLEMKEKTTVRNVGKLQFK